MSWLRRVFFPEPPSVGTMWRSRATGSLWIVSAADGQWVRYRLDNGGRVPQQPDSITTPRCFHACFSPVQA